MCASSTPPLRKMAINKGKDTRLEVDVWCSSSAGRLPSAVSPELLRVLAKKMLKAAGVRDARLSIALLSAAAIRRLNRVYLGHDFVTDVVTFNLGSEKSRVRVERGRGTVARGKGKRRPFHFSPLACDVYGEICICPGVAQRNAKKYSEPFERELMRYIAHGILHLGGFDDRTAFQRKAMRVLEDKCLEMASL